MNKIFSFVCCIIISSFSLAQTYTVEELKNKFKHVNYTDKLLLEFHKSIAHLEEKPDLYEYIPGEIIAWSFMDGRFLLNSMFLIENDSLKKIDAMPNDEVFLSTLNSYVPEKSRFIYRTELWTIPFVKEKLANKSYLIKATVKSYNPRPYEPSDDILTYNIEYTTKDFKKFRLVRLKDAKADKWIKVGKY